MGLDFDLLANHCAALHTTDDPDCAGRFDDYTTSLLLRFVVAHIERDVPVVRAAREAVWDLFGESIEDPIYDR